MTSPSSMDVNVVTNTTEPPKRKRKIEIDIAAEPDGLAAPTAAYDDESSDEDEATSIMEKDYTRQLRESDGFDLDITIPVPSFAVHKCDNEKTFYRGLIDIFARVGLHSYNLRKDTKFHLSSVDKYITHAIFNYYLTFEAMDPATNSCFTFQARVTRSGHAQGWRIMAEGCRIKPQVPGTGEIIHRWQYIDGIDPVYKGTLPNWYSDDALMSSSDKHHQFYQAQDSDIRDNDWLNMYAYVALYSLQEGEAMFESWLPLEIKKVVVQTYEHVKSKEKLKAGNAIFYISVTNLNAPPHGLCQDHRVIVRRTTTGLPGHVSLEFQVLRQE